MYVIGYIFGVIMLLAISEVKIHKTNTDYYGKSGI